MKYSVHPGIAMAQQSEAQLKKKSGRSLPEWIAFVKKKGPKAEAEQRAWLKQTHGLGTNTAWWIAERTNGGDEKSSPEKYLKAADA